MSIKQAIEALECAQDALDISQSLQESAKSNHHPKTLAAYERVSAALAALRSMPQGEPVAWLHTMDNTEGFEENEPWCELTFDEENPFGVPGQDYSESYPVTSVPLSATPHTEAVRMSEAEIDAIYREVWSTITHAKRLSAFARAVEQATAARLGVKSFAKDAK